MHASTRLVVLSLSVLGLSACATSHPVARAPAAEPPPAGEIRYERDHAYIAYVERLALRRGMQVQWVNPPNRRVAED